MNSTAWGRDELMVVAAFRYSLSRSTYIVGDCADWLVAHWDQFTDNTRAVIQRDLERAFLADDAIRAAGGQYPPLGMDCDRADWKRVRKLWEVKR